MQQSRGGGFFWAKISRGEGSMMQQRARARWEPIYRESALHPAVVLGEAQDWAIWEYGPRIHPPPDEAPEGAFHGE